MAKLTREQKLEIYYKRKSGESIAVLSKRYDIRDDNIKYLVRLIDTHGEDVLRKDKNKYYSPELKLEIINKVLLEKQSIKSTAIECGLSCDGMLHSWLKCYKENGSNIVEKTKGRPSTMKKRNKTNQSK